MDFLEGDPTLYDFPKAQAGGSRPSEPPEINPPCTSISSPKPNFNFVANMEDNRPWIDDNAIYVPGAQHPLP